MHASIIVWLVIPYLLLITLFIFGWFRRSIQKKQPLSGFPLVSVLVPIHNEAENIPGLVEQLDSQDYPRDRFEIIFLDDHSEDESLQLLTERVGKITNRKVETLPENLSGKKRAIQYGLKCARGEFILTTDADCLFQREWIASMVEWYRKYPDSLLIGPVMMEEQTGWWGRFQSLEFLSLVASGAGASGVGHPILCNGANLGASLELFELAKEIYESSVASGDDIFLMLELKRQGKTAVFVKDRKAVVTTRPTRNLKQFLNQRSRWTFKSRFYRDFDIILTAIVVLLTNLILLAGLPVILFNTAWFPAYGIAYLLKSVVDYILLYYVATFFERRQLLKYFFFQQLVYIFYVSWVGIVGHRKRTKW